MKFSAGPCVLLLLVSEWTKAMSSVSSARWGSRSETHLPVLPRCRNGYWGRARFPRRTLEGDRRPARQRLAVQRDQGGLIIPRLQLADRSGAENHHHVAGAGGKMRWPGGEGAGGIEARSGGGEESVLAEQAGQGDRTQGRWRCGRGIRGGRGGVAPRGRGARRGSREEQEFVAVEQGPAEDGEAMVMDDRDGVVEFVHGGGASRVSR
jgi:hypothetical protein